MKYWLGTALILAVPAAAQNAAVPAPAQDAPAPAAFNAAEAKAAVEKLATLLEDNFVFPDAGRAYASMLRKKLADGAYASFPNAADFAKAVTADLQAIHADGHLRLNPPPTGAAAPAPRPPLPGAAGAIQRAGWIAPGIAYISFSWFPGDEATVAGIRKFLTDHASAKTLIIDARVHRGGGLAEMDALFPAIFAKPTALVDMDTRLAVEEAGGGVAPDGPTLKRIAGPDSVVRREHSVTPDGKDNALKSAKIYLLTAGRTASAAEHLSLSLKRTRRATLIGERTAGAGHFGQTQQLGNGYSAFIPVGRTFDPDTNEGWEGTGVKPDIEVPAEQALAKALVLSGLSAADAERLAKEYRPEGSMERRRPLVSK